MKPRNVASITLAFFAGLVARWQLPFPDDNVVLELVAFHKPALFVAIKTGYGVMMFTTPYVLFSAVFSIGYIFTAKPEGPAGPGKLPNYPDVARRKQLFVVLGEVHHPRKCVPVARPEWLTIPERGLYTGIMVLGAIGSGKTSGCVYPLAEQILGYRAADATRRIGGLVLEVKGDFCRKLREILERHGRGCDYMGVSLDSPYRYNPLYNDLDAYAQAYGIASLLINLYGRGKEPFWQQAYTNLVKFVILLYRVLYDYVTLFDVYEGVINPKKLETMIAKGERKFGAATQEFYFVTVEAFMAHPELEAFPFELDREANRMKAPASSELSRVLGERAIEFEVESVSGSSAATGQAADSKRAQFEAVKRWYENDWSRIDAKLRTSIVEGISVFLSLFDDNPAVKRVFCPPKETYDPVANVDGRYGVPLPPFAELIEKGQVCALDFPVAGNPGLAKIIGTLMKHDFQRAVLSRIPRMEESRGEHFREVLFLCDEYHSFATVGENDPSGDEKFFALSRQAKCIPIVATQSISSLRSSLPGESWRTLLQTFRTKIFLALSDDFSARTASELCGKEEQLKVNYNINEHGQDAGVELLFGKPTARKATLGASKGYHLQRDYLFEAKVFAELKNAQAVVLAYDGLNPMPPSRLYLKPYFLDPNVSYFEHLAAGRL